MDKHCWSEPLDVTSLDSIKAFTGSVIAHYGRIDALINNAGFNKQKDIIDYYRRGVRQYH